LKLFDIAKIIDAQIFGNKNQNIIGLCSTNNPKNQCISFLLNKHSCSENFFNSIGAVLIEKSLCSSIPKGVNILLVENVKFAFAKLTPIFKDFKNEVVFCSSINGSDYLNTKIGVNVGKNFTCGNNVIIQDHVKIGNNVSIGHNVVISSRTSIGDNVNIGDGTIIGSEGFGNIFFGNDWLHIVHIGGVIIKNNVSIGGNCNIDRGTIDDTIIENGVIIDNQVHLAHNVLIGEKSAIAAKVGIAGSCNIGKRNMIGGMVGIVDHITTADDVTISATTTVNKNIMESGVYTGIMPISKHVTWKRIALWITKLDKIAKFLKIKKI